MKVEDISPFKGATASCDCGCIGYYEKGWDVYCKSCHKKTYKNECRCGRDKKSYERLCWSCTEWELGGL